MFSFEDDVCKRIERTYILRGNTAIMNENQNKVSFIKRVIYSTHSCLIPTHRCFFIQHGHRYFRFITWEENDGDHAE